VTRGVDATQLVENGEKLAIAVARLAPWVAEAAHIARTVFY
jgi:hypothetical protein